MEDLAIAVGQAKDAVIGRDSGQMVLTLTEISARAIPLRRDQYPDVWQLAEYAFDPKQGWSDALAEDIGKKADSAQNGR